jgi:hypothetical protein
MEDNSRLTPDRSLTRGSINHNGVENVNWILDTNDKTLLSDRTDRIMFVGFLMGTIMPFHPGRASQKGKKKQRKFRKRRRKKSEGPIPMDWEPLSERPIPMDWEPLSERPIPMDWEPL